MVRFSIQIILVVKLLFLMKDAMTNKNNLGKEEQERKYKRWAQLPSDLLELIIRHLSLKDCLELRAVCSSWRSIISNAITNKHCYPLPEPPIAVLQYIRGIQFDDPCSILSIEHPFNSKRPLLYHVHSNKICLGSIGGWMIMCDNFYNDTSLSPLLIYFLNPVTHVRIMVKSKLSFPSNSPLDKDQLQVSKIVTSSQPHDPKTCFLVALFTDYCHIAFCRLSDESWTMIKAEQEQHFMDLEFLGSKLYVRTNRSILVFDELFQVSENGTNISKPTSSVQALLPPIIPQTIFSVVPGNPVLHYVFGGVIYFMAKDESLQELFLISLHLNAIHDTRRVSYLNLIDEFITPLQIIKMQVFKLCQRNSTNENNGRFVKVDDLGDRVLFLTGWKNVLISSALVNRNEELVKPNTIYFAIHYPCSNDPWKGSQLGVYGLADNDIKYYSIDERRSEYDEPPCPIWFVPSLW